MHQIGCEAKDIHDGGKRDEKKSWQCFIGLESEIIIKEIGASKAALLISVDHYCFPVALPIPSGYLR